MMMWTLATGIEEAAAIASWVGAASAVAGTTVSIMQAQRQNAKVKKAEQIAAAKAAQDKLAGDAKAAQERSLAARRLATQVDSARVTAGAAGASGGASELVLESSFGAAARQDLANISANNARGTFGTGMSLDNTMNRLDSERINPFAAGITGIAQGIGTFTTVNDGLNSLFPKTPAAPPPEVPFAGGNVQPATGVVAV